MERAHILIKLRDILSLSETVQYVVVTHDKFDFSSLNTPSDL